MEKGVSAVYQIVTFWIDCLLWLRYIPAVFISQFFDKLFGHFLGPLFKGEAVTAASDFAKQRWVAPPAIASNISEFYS